MIHRTASSWQGGTPKGEQKPEQPSLSPSLLTEPTPLAEQPWQQQLQQAVTNPEELLSLLQLDKRYLAAARAASQLFPLRVPHAFLARIKKGNINDPLLQQVLPVAAELHSVKGYSLDPVGEQQNQPSGLIHKYHGRILLVVNGHCAVNCRYCFRRHFPYADNRLNRTEWEQAIETIAHDASISEVIYSGGDPLASSDSQLQWLTQKIANIPHIKRLRIHTRLPVVIPRRINSASLKWMTEHHLATVVVLHINHANELRDQTLLNAIQQMKAAGITLLNQAVFLRGVNDNSSDLIKLSESLFGVGIMPYYLHVLDKVRGSAHFDSEPRLIKKIYKEISAQLPGYMVPKLVREIAGQASKTLVYP